MIIIQQDFYLEPTLQVTRGLLGAILETNIDGKKTSGIIVETEAYLSTGDPACHASKGVTKRNREMFNNGGIAYIYFIYGMHYCFNVVTEAKDSGCAVLIRGIEPLDGIEIMQERRKITTTTDLTNGPGKICSAFGINIHHNGAELFGNSGITIYQGKEISQSMIKTSSRIGISQGGELQYRYFIKDNRFVSKR